jgi:hypothetical protein
VNAAARKVDLAQNDVASAEHKVAPLKAALASAEKEVAALDAKHASLVSTPPASPGFSGTTCKSRRGAVYGCPADGAAQKTYAAARSDYARQLQEIDGQRAKAQQAATDLQHQLAAIDVATPAAALSLARRDASDAAETSPMHRIAGSWFGVKAGDVTADQFASFRKYAVGGLSISLATMSALVGWLAFQEPSKERESKLSRALRAYVARRRKGVVRIVEREVSVGERVVEVPVEKIVEKPVTVIKYLPQFLPSSEMELRDTKHGMAAFRPARPEPIPAVILGD